MRAPGVGWGLGGVSTRAAGDAGGAALGAEERACAARVARAEGSGRGCSRLGSGPEVVAIPGEVEARAGERPPGSRRPDRKRGPGFLSVRLPPLPLSKRAGSSSCPWRAARPLIRPVTAGILAAGGSFIRPSAAASRKRVRPRGSVWAKVRHRVASGAGGGRSLVTQPGRALYAHSQSWS